MKLLDVPALSVLQQCAECVSGLSLHLQCFSLKNVGEDTRLAKHLNTALEGERLSRRQRALSFSSVLSAAAAVGGSGEDPDAPAAVASTPHLASRRLDLDDATARKTLFWLISMLNSAFSDYDFRCAEALRCDALRCVVSFVCCTPLLRPLTPPAFSPQLPARALVRAVL